MVATLNGSNGTKHRIELSWYSDLKFESDIKRMAVPYEVVSIPFAKINLRESQVNGARINDAIRENRVEDYMQGMRNGDTFPRPVVHHTASGYVILSGNQRCESINRLIADGELPKTTEVEVYLVETSDRTLLEVIARTANVSHGDGDSKEDRTQQALYFVRGLGLTIKDAAKYLMVSEANIGHRIRAEEQRKFLAISGVDARGVPVSSLEPLAKLDFDESAKLKLGTLIAQHQPPAERIRQVSAVLAKQSSSQSRIQKIKEFEKELAEEAHQISVKRKAPAEKSRVPSRPRRDKLVRLLTQLLNFLECENNGEPFMDMDELQVTSKADVEKASSLIKKLQFRLKVISI